MSLGTPSGGGIRWRPPSARWLPGSSGILVAGCSARRWLGVPSRWPSRGGVASTLSGRGTCWAARACMLAKMRLRPADRLFFGRSLFFRRSAISSFSSWSGRHSVLFRFPALDSTASFTLFGRAYLPKNSTSANDLRLSAFLTFATKVKPVRCRLRLLAAKKLNTVGLFVTGVRSAKRARNLLPFLSPSAIRFWFIFLHVRARYSTVGARVALPPPQNTAFPPSSMGGVLG